jgi:hypothetical protein
MVDDLGLETQDTLFVHCQVYIVHCALSSGSGNTVHIHLELPNKSTMVTQYHPVTHIQIQ